MASEAWDTSDALFGGEGAVRDPLRKVAGGCIEILVVGADDVATSRLAHALATAPGVHRRNVPVSETLRLPVDDKRPRIDLVVLTVHAAKAATFERAQAALRELPHCFSPARALLLCWDFAVGAHAALDVAAVETLAEDARLDVIHARAHSDASIAAAAGRVVRAASVGHGDVAGVTPLLLKTVEAELVEATYL